MAVDGYLNFDTKIDTKGFSNGLKNIGSSLSSLKSKLIGVAAAMGLAFGAKEALESAAEINAANAQLEQTFGSLQSTAEAAMKRVADTSGIVETRLKGVGTSIYAFAKASGMESAQALGMMENALQIAADSAAYYDRSLEDTSETLKSFLKGNYANDGALGISCTETTRNAAANKLYSKSYQELSEAQKQLVLLQMVKDANDLSGATGQAAREAEDWENVLGNLKEAWKQLLAVIGQPILTMAISTVQRLTAALTALTAKAQIAVNTLSKLFGIEKSSAEGVAAQISAGVTEQNALTDAVNETAEAQKNALAGFDKINTVSDSSGGGSSSENSVVEIPAVDSGAAIDSVKETVDEINNALSRMLEPFVQSWNDYGAPLMESIRTSWNEVLRLIGAVGSSFAAVWQNGTGYTIVSDILQIFTNISDTIGSIARQFSTAWSGGSGERIVQSLANFFIIILNTINRCTEATSNWADSLDFSPVLESIADLFESIEPLADNVGKAFEWVYTEVLLPLASWMIEDAAPASIDVLSDAIDALNAIVEVFKPMGKWLWNNFLKKIANWTGGVITDTLIAVSDALENLGDWISDHISAIQDFVIVVGALGAALKIASIIQAATTAFTTMGGIAGVLTAIETGLTAVTTALSAAFAFLTSPITLICLGIAAIIAIGVLLVKHWDEVKEFAVGLWESIQETLWAFFDWVTEKFNDIVEFLGGVWQSIKDIFSVVGEWFKSKFSEAWNNIKKIFSAAKGFFTDRWNEITGIFSAVGTWFKTRFTAAWDGIKSAFSSVKTWFTDRWNDITGIFSGVGTWFSEKFTSAVDNVKSAFSSIGTFFKLVWNNIKSPFTTAVDWFKDKFTAIKDKITEVFSDIGTALKAPVNGIIDLINGLLDKLESGLNWIVDGLNSALSIDIPEGIPKVGGTHFGLDLPHIDLPEIPRLAQGTVVPANYGEFLSILGDNRREAEVVSPLSTIEKAVTNAMKKNAGQGGDIHVHVMMSEREIGRAAIKYTELEKARRGG